MEVLEEEFERTIELFKERLEEERVRVS